MKKNIFLIWSFYGVMVSMMDFWSAGHGFKSGPKQADYLLLYEQNWLKEGTEALVLKKTAASSK